MGISHDIISEFVKITNDKKEKPKEETVYATIVQASDGKYVKLDGSDLITPTETTTDIAEGERVTVLIKDHSAIITGNITSPSASANRVNGIVDVVSEKLGVFETIVADKIDVNELNAYKATVEHLIAGKAEIEDLKATRAEIGFLDADVAHIKTLVNGNLTSDNILSFNITADKVTMADAFIKDAMVDTLNAAKINAGRLNTNNVVIGSDDGGMLISGATQQFTDKNGKVRIQIGRDSTGDFTFVLYGEDGTGQIINQNGITASALSDGLIVNDMINNNAAISGGKLDISSVIFEINNENDTAIHSSKIYLDEQNQSLEAAFNSLKTQVDTIVDISIDGDLKAFTEQIQSNTAKIEMNKSSINTLVSEDAIIRKEVSDLEGNLIEATNTLSTKYSSLEQNIDGFKLEAADVYAKKTTVEDLENNITTNYSTTEAMNSAITQKANEINLEVSQTINSIQTGGKNLIKNGNFEDGLNHWVYERFSGIDSDVFEIWDGSEWCMDGKKQCSLSVYDIDDSNRKGEWTVRQSFKTVIGQEYTVSYMIAGHRTYKTVAIRQDGNWAYLGSKDYHDIYGGKNANDWVYDSITFTATTSKAYIWFITREVTSSTFGHMWFTDVCCVEGNKAQRFIPSLEEYSTTAQMNSSIEQKAENIALSVSETKINDLKIGGANLLLNSDIKKQLDRAEPGAYNQISYKLISDYADSTLANDTTFALSFLVERIGNTEYECFASIAFDAGWRTRWFVQHDIDKVIHVKNSLYKFVMKPITLPKGTNISDRLTFIAEYEFGGALIYNVMLVEGDKALDWSLASYDIQNSIARIDIKADEISSTVNTTIQNLNNNYPTTSYMNSAIQQAKDSIKSEVSKIEKSMAIDNLLANGNFTNGLIHWTYHANGYDVGYSLSSNTYWTMTGKTALLLTHSYHPQGHDSGFTQAINVKRNTDYTFTGYIASHRAEGLAIIKDAAGGWLIYDKTNPDYDEYTGSDDITKWKRIRLVYHSGERDQLQFHLAMGKSNENGHVWFHDFMVTEGNTDLCWKPSERETRTEINQLSDRITATVSSVEMVNGKVNQANSDIGILADRITATVSSVEMVNGKVNQANSDIGILADRIYTKVSTGDLSSLIQQNSSSIYAAISNGRGVNGVGIDTSGLYLHNNNLVTARLTEGKFHAYNSWNGNHMGYFGTNGDDLRACLYGTNTFSLYSNDSALLFKARYDRDSSYGNATLDMCGGINFIHKPGQSVGINQILLGNDDRADIYGYHNLSIRAHNSLGFMDNNGYTNMFFATRTGSIVMKGTVYQNSQSGISTFSLLRSREAVNDYGYTTEDMVNAILTLDTSVNVDENEDYSMRICYSENELVTKILDDSLHIDQSSVIAGLVETVKTLNKRILELESERNK